MTADTTLESSEPILRLKVDKRSPVPMYVQIGRAIREMIESRELPPDSLLPPSKVLCKQLGITHMTLRQAYTMLEQDGLLEPQRGRGTWIRRPRIERTLEDIGSFSEYIARKGKTPSSRVLLFERREPTLVAAAYLESGSVYHLKRLRFADNIPMVIEEVEILAALCPGLEKFDFAHESLYRVLEQEYDLQFVRAVQTLSASVAEPADRALLETGPRVAVLVVSGHTKLKGDRPAMVGNSRYRGDLYAITIQAERGSRR